MWSTYQPDYQWNVVPVHVFSSVIEHQMKGHPPQSDGRHEGRHEEHLQRGRVSCSWDSSATDTCHVVLGLPVQLLVGFNDEDGEETRQENP